MFTQLFQEVISYREATLQVELPLATEGTVRYVEQSRFSNLLIELVDCHTYVNGELVRPAFAERAKSDSRDRVYVCG